MWDLFLDKLDTGFLNLYLFSNLYISDETEVRGLAATKNAVLSASAQSNVYTSKGVKFINNLAESSEGQTLSFLNTEIVQIEDTEFISNPQINIGIKLGTTLSVRNSSFTNGKKQHIFAE